MTKKITYRNLPQLLLKARDQIMQSFRPILLHFGLTEQQWRIIRALSEHDELEPREIGRICQILSPSMAGVLQRMEEMGLVQRDRVATDQRRVMVRLTRKSMGLVSEISPLVEAQYRHIEEALGQKLVEQIYVILDRLIEKETVEVKRIALPKKATGGSRAIGKKRSGASSVPSPRR